MDTTLNYTLLDYAIAFGPILVGLAGIYYAYRLNLKTLKQQSNAARKDDIRKKLNEFYGPLQQLRKKNQNLYTTLSFHKEKDVFTLQMLLEDPLKFSPNDKEIIKRILKINKELEKLIHSKCGLVDDAGLIEVLGKASAHISILDLAAAGRIKGEFKKFEEYKFPEDLDDKIKEKVKRHIFELNQLDEF